MSIAEPRGLVTRARGLSPRAAVLTGGGLMVAGLVSFLVLWLAGAGLPTPGASALVVVPALLAGIVMLWLGPVVVAVAGGQPGWVGALAFPVGCAVWIVGTFMAGSLADGAALTGVESALSVVGFAGALAVVGGGLVWRRLAAVTVIAGLTGVAGYLSAGSAAVYVGLVVAVGCLAWMSPPTRPL